MTAPRGEDRDPLGWMPYILAQLDPTIVLPPTRTTIIANRYQYAQEINRTSPGPVFKSKKSWEKPRQTSNLRRRHSTGDNDRENLIYLVENALLDARYGRLTIREIHAHVNEQLPNKYSLRDVQKLVPREFQLLDRFSDGEPIQYNKYRRYANRLYKIRDSEMTDEMQERLFDRDSESLERESATPESQRQDPEEPAMPQEMGTEEPEIKQEEDDEEECDHDELIPYPGRPLSHSAWLKAAKLARKKKCRCCRPAIRADQYYLSATRYCKALPQ